MLAAKSKSLLQAASTQETASLHLPRTSIPVPQRCPGLPARSLRATAVVEEAKVESYNQHVREGHFESALVSRQVRR